MQSVTRLQERIAAMTRRGVPLERVEREVIDRSSLTAEQKDALWLYAWSCIEGKERDNGTYLLNVGPG